MTFCARVQTRFNITAKPKPTKMPRSAALQPSRTWPDAHNFTVKQLPGPHGTGTGKVQLRDEEGNVVLEVQDQELHALVDAGQLTPKNWAKGLIRLAKQRGIVKGPLDAMPPARSKVTTEDPEDIDLDFDLPESKPAAKSDQRGGRRSNEPKPVGDVKPAVLKKPAKPAAPEAEQPKGPEAEQPKGPEAAPEDPKQPSFDTDQGRPKDKDQRAGKPDLPADLPADPAAPPAGAEPDDDIEVYNRLEYIKNMNPLLLLVGTQNKSNLIHQSVVEAFNKQSKDLRGNKKLIQVLLQPNDGKVRGIYGFIGEANSIKQLAKWAEDPPGVAADQKQPLPKALIKLSPELLAREDPFAECPIDAAFIRNIIPDIALVRERLYQVWARLGGQTDEESPSGVSAMQFNGVLPLDYMRFLNVKLATRRYYVSGMPERAGYPGMVYALCTKPEADHFFKEMKSFKQPPMFFEDVRFLSDIDREFKNYDPQKRMPARALILLAKDKFERRHVDQLTRFAHEVLKAPAGAGGRNPRFLTGNSHVNINQDATRAILWGSHARVQVTLEGVIDWFKDDKGESFVQGIDTRYL